MDGDDSGFTEHPPRFVSVGRRGPTVDVAAHFRHRRSGQTMRQTGWLLFDRPCLLCRNASAPTEASPRGCRPGSRDTRQVAWGWTALLTRRGEPRPRTPGLGNIQSSAFVSAARLRIVNFDKMLLLPLLSNPESRKEASRDDPDKVCPAKWPVKLRRLPSYTLWSQVACPAVLRS